METLARMRRGGERVVRKVHVDKRGGQVVIAEKLQTGRQGNRRIGDQSQATGMAGTAPALFGADPFGSGDVTPNLHPVAIRASASLLRVGAGEARGCVA